MTETARAADSWRMQATVFGLHVRADRMIGLLAGAPARSTERPLDLIVHEGESAESGEPGEPGWRDSAQVICSRRDADGSESFRIEAHPQDGYLIWARDRGSHRLSLDGRHLRCSPPAPLRKEWERFLIGQVLPFAALVSGLEIFHASAVALRGRAIALAGPSGSGKTSVALALCERGASFLADDVLALEVREHELLAHPGAPVAGIDRREAGRLRARGRLPRGEMLMSNAREQVVRVGAAAGQAPLGALFFLDRREQGPPEPEFEAVTDPQVLLAATFNFVLGTPARLRGLLDVCALAARRRVERVLIGPATDASERGGAIERRLGVPA